MTANAPVGACLSRASNAFERRPSAAVQEDSPAVAVWDGALGTKLMHSAMPELRTDIAVSLGGDGAGRSAGRYFRGGVASCMVTSIPMLAPMRRVAMNGVEVQACRVSDSRGMFGMSPKVPPGPLRFWLTLTLEAPDTPHDVLRNLVEAAHSLAPLSGALRQPIDLAPDLRLAATGA